MTRSWSLVARVDSERVGPGEMGRGIALKSAKGVHHDSHACRGGKADAFEQRPTWLLGILKIERGMRKLASHAEILARAHCGIDCRHDADDRGWRPLE